MYQRKIQGLTRKNYYLSVEEKKAIRDYVIAHPEMPQDKIAQHFGVSRGLVSNIQRTPSKYDFYEKKIEELTKENKRLSAKITALEKQIKTK